MIARGFLVSLLQGPGGSLANDLHHSTLVVLTLGFRACESCCELRRNDLTGVIELGSIKEAKVRVPILGSVNSVPRRYNRRKSRIFKNQQCGRLSGLGLGSLSGQRPNFGGEKQQHPFWDHAQAEIGTAPANSWRRKMVPTDHTWRSWPNCQLRRGRQCSTV